MFNRDGLNVAVVENGVAHIRHVTLVRDLGTAVEVSAGVTDTDHNYADLWEKGKSKTDYVRAKAF